MGLRSLNRHILRATRAPRVLSVTDNGTEHRDPPMPRLSEFRGIAIEVYYKDHPPPHFHVVHTGERAAVEIATGSVMRGSLSPRAHRLVREWLELHRSELELSFARAVNEEQPDRIEPMP